MEENALLNKDKVACIILNYNDAGNTAELAREVEGYNLLDHIIIVDNMSTDGSMERLAGLASDKITVRSSGKNGGYGYGNNCGARIAKGEYGCKYAFICNSDVQCSEENMQETLHCFENHSDCAVATGIQRKSDGTTSKNMAWDIPSAANYAITAMFISSRLYSKHKIIENEYEKAECILGSCYCVDLYKFLYIGGFDENIFLYCEETSLGIRVKRGGFSEYVVRDAFYYHYHDNGSIARNVKTGIIQKKYLLASRLHIVQTYLARSKLDICFAKFCYAIAMAEGYIKMWILELFRTKGTN